MNKLLNIFFVISFLFITFEVSSKNIVLKNNIRLSFDDINSLTSFDLNSSNINEDDLNLIVKDLISNDLIIDITTSSDIKNFYLLKLPVLVTDKK